MASSPLYGFGPLWGRGSSSTWGQGFLLQVQRKSREGRAVVMMAAPGGVVCALRMCCWPCHTTAPVRCPLPRRCVMRCVYAGLSRAARALASGPRERVIVSESAAVQESLRRHRQDASVASMASMGLPESVEVSPRPKDTSSNPSMSGLAQNARRPPFLSVTLGPQLTSATNRSSIRSQIQMATERQAKRIRLCGGMQVTRSVQPASHGQSQRARREEL